MSAAASHKKSVGSISTRGFLKHFAASRERRTWRFKNISYVARICNQKQPFFIPKWGLCLDHLQHWLGKELCWSPRGLSLHQRERRLPGKPSQAYMPEFNISFCGTAVELYTRVWTSCRSTRCRRNTKARILKGKLAARKVVSSLYVRVQDLISRHSRTVQNLVPKHEGKFVCFVWYTLKWLIYCT